MHATLKTCGYKVCDLTLLIQMHRTRTFYYIPLCPKRIAEGPWIWTDLCSACITFASSHLEDSLSGIHRVLDYTKFSNVSHNNLKTTLQICCRFSLLVPGFKLEYSSQLSGQSSDLINLVIDSFYTF